MFDASSLSLSTDDQFVIRLANAVFFFSYFQILILMPPHLSHITTTYFLEQLLSGPLLVQYNSLNDNENMI